MFKSVGTFNMQQKTGFDLQLVVVVVVVFFTAISMLLASATAKAVEFPPMVASDVALLQDNLGEMKKLAPKLRMQLRTVRSQVEFDVRQIHNIERSISQSERDLERLIMMHRGDRFSELRAHFLVDDLRRKAKIMHEGENYVLGMIERLQENQDDRLLPMIEQYNQLFLILGEYNQLIDQCLNIITSQKEMS
ncbi:MAG: hypothetical protein ABW104_13980 [Candidatus Thiodiazotropha sp. 6PLUC2]